MKVLGATIAALICSSLWHSSTFNKLDRNGFVASHTNTFTFYGKEPSEEKIRIQRSKDYVCTEGGGLKVEGQDGKVFFNHLINNTSGNFLLVNPDYYKTKITFFHNRTELKTYFPQKWY